MTVPVSPARTCTTARDRWFSARDTKIDRITIYLPFRRPDRRAAAVRRPGSAELRDDLLAPLPDGLHADLLGDGAHLDHALDLVDAHRRELLDELGGVLGGAVRVVHVVRAGRGRRHRDVRLVE